MNLLEFVFIKLPRKIFRLFFYKLEYLYYRFFYAKPRNIDIPKAAVRYFLRDGHVEIAELFKKQLAGKVEEKVKEADLICRHIFDLLGSGPRKLSKEGEGYQSIDWHSDFKSGYQWDSRIFFRNVRFGHKEGVDIKVPWELSRSQHFTILGQAYLLTKGEKYAREFVNQLTDWIEHNPPGFGVNWFCPMDAAIRAVNWLVALEYFSESKEISQLFLQKIYLSIYEHGKFIRNHLETRPVKTNHYLADIAGLFFISIYCPFFKESKKWQRFSVKELEKEIQHQVYPDGCNFEASTSYHRLALEIFFYCELLAKRCGILFSNKYQQRLKKMFEFSLYCIKPNGRIPQIGDNDNGRLLVFCKRPVLEHKYLLSLASIYYGDSDFKLPEFGFDEEALWVFGKEGIQIFLSLPSREKSLNSKAFADAGWYILRHKNDYCFVSCGPNGQDGRGGHAHNDKLSFELVVNGKDLIIDPGTYVYTPYPKERNKFRSTSYHNTIKSNDYEQNEISESKNDIFILPDRVKIKNTDLKEAGNKITFQNEIQYKGNKHKRIIILDKEAGNLQIIDHIFSSKPTNVKLIFHLSPGMFFDNNYISSKETGKKVAGIEVGGYKLENEEYNYSSEYGLKIKAKDLLINIDTGITPKIINTFINLL